MTGRDRDPAVARWAIIATIRIAAAAGAVFGLILAARAYALGPKALGIAIIVSALFMMAVVPRALVERWRSPPPPRP